MRVVVPFKGSIVSPFSWRMNLWKVNSCDYGMCLVLVQRVIIVLRVSFPWTIVEHGDGDGDGVVYVFA